MLEECLYPKMKAITTNDNWNRMSWVEGDIRKENLIKANCNGDNDNDDDEIRGNN